MALALAVLFFAFVELLMIDASRELSEARRFRGRIVALTLAENGAELAAKQIVSNEKADAKEEDWQGTFSATMKRNKEDGKFEIVSTAHSKGPEGTSAKVLLEGVAAGSDVRILFSRHAQ